MTGNKNHSRWQDIQLRKLEGLVHDPLFKKDLASLPSLANFKEYSLALGKLTEKYGLSLLSAIIINKYIKTGEISAESVVPSMAIICNKDETSGPTDSIELAQFNYLAHKGFLQDGVHIFVPPGTSHSELKSFIKDYWSYIEDKIGKPQRIRRASKAKRNTEIVRLHNDNHTNKQILKIIDEDYLDPLTIDDIARIIRTHKKI